MQIEWSALVLMSDASWMCAEEISSKASAVEQIASETKAAKAAAQLR